MISLVQHDNNIWKASDGTLELLYCKDTGYINATQMCRFICKKNRVKDWSRTAHTVAVETHLLRQLSDDGQTRFKVDTKAGSEVYIHPALTIHLANWFGPKYNYPTCKLLQQITINTAMGNVITKINVNRSPAPSLLVGHSFLF